jgi:hypothetical protein
MTPLFREPGRPKRQAEHVLERRTQYKKALLQNHVPPEGLGIKLCRSPFAAGPAAIHPTRMSSTGPALNVGQAAKTKERSCGIRPLPSTCADRRMAWQTPRRDRLLSADVGTSRRARRSPKLFKVRRAMTARHISTAWIDPVWRHNSAAFRRPFVTRQAAGHAQATGPTRRLTTPAFPGLQPASRQAWRSESPCP